jgi:hypothetical protein
LRELRSGCYAVGIRNDGEKDAIMAQRYCTNCGAELGEDDSFCGKCGSPTYQTAAVATQEADVPVPALSREATSGQTPYEEAGRTSEADSTRNTFVALGITVLVIALLAAIVAKSAGWIVALVIVLGVIFYRLVFSGGHQETSAKDAGGRLVLRVGYTEPVSEAERSRELEEEIAQYMSDGFFVRQRTATTAQLVRPKRFSFVWALLWFLVFGVGIIVYLIYYAAKQDEGRYVEVDEYGAIKATRQIRHVL